MAGGRHGAQQKLGPGENSIATAKMQVIRDKDGNVTLRIDKNMVVADNSDLQRQ